ncbi:hypothetical protein DFA_01064 [Cavenderia fasciculata]|uniref:Regulator of chromosome condensation domain-containing protein n=1 Tax=Cavenderia fasciculata TaxID=261658 RepID=F4PQM2_CACFS|nr:uncharacterized protein DFA_01064 [Cavenderia fasciculata]EGG21189.1 hypothetical protein DFA_01064 [Cavenderia fasciculata]|eukprot:XP_004359039.1 hypothetical protein DFA_01064 [Cavenderia fasciculata]
MSYISVVLFSITIAIAVTVFFLKRPSTTNRPFRIEQQQQQQQNNNNNNNNNIKVKKLSNLILLNIIEKIDDNVDLICFLLTCKRLYYSIRQHKNIRFKDIGYINAKDCLNEYLLDRLSSSSCLPSFKHIFANALSNQMMIVTSDNTYNTKHVQANGLVNFYVLETNNNNHRFNIDQKEEEKEETNQSSSSSSSLSSIEKIVLLLNDNNDISDTHITKLPSTPRVLLIRNPSKPVNHPFGYIPPSVKDLVLSCRAINCEKIFLGNHIETLRLLIARIESNNTIQLPLGLKTFVLLPFGPYQQQWTFNFLALLSLTTLKLEVYLQIRYYEIRILCLDLEPLVSLETLIMDAKSHIVLSQSISTLKHLQLLRYSTINFIPNTLSHLVVSTDTYMKFIKQSQQIPTLTNGPSIVVLPFLKHLEIQGMVSHLDHSDQSYIPHGVTSLDMTMSHKYRYTGLIPPSVVKLALKFNQRPSEAVVQSFKLPDTIKQLTWKGYHLHLDRYTGVPFIFPSLLEKLKYFPNTSDHINTKLLPQSTTSLSILAPNFFNNNNNSNSSSGVETPSISLLDCIHVDDANKNRTPANNTTISILGPNIKQLKWKFSFASPSDKFSIRLDQVINQTNVQELTVLVFNKVSALLDIRRLDNSNVLIIDKPSLIGGFITQRKRPTITTTTTTLQKNIHQSDYSSSSYEPLYLHFKRNQPPFLILKRREMYRLGTNQLQQRLLLSTSTSILSTTTTGGSSSSCSNGRSYSSFVKKLFERMKREDSQIKEKQDQEKFQQERQELLKIRELQHQQLKSLKGGLNVDKAKLGFKWSKPPLGMDRSATLGLPSFISSSPISQSPEQLEQQMQDQQNFKPTAVYSIGTNTQGQLGLGDCVSEEQFIFMETLTKESIKSLRSSISHSAILTNTSDLLTWGSNAQFQIGHKDGTLTSILPSVVENIPHSVRKPSFPRNKVIDVGLGGWHNFAVTREMDGSTQLYDLDIATITSGPFHSVALDRRGRVYQWGCGAIASSKKDHIHYTPQSLSDNALASLPNFAALKSRVVEITGFLESSQIVQIAAGDNLSLAVTNQGELYAWNTVDTHAKRIEMKEFADKRVVKVATSFTHTGVILEGIDNPSTRSVLLWPSRSFQLDRELQGSFFSTITDQPKLYTFPSDHHITDLSLGVHFALVLASENKQQQS